VEWWVVPKFEILTDAIWARELKRARGVKNYLSEQIKMRLHPENETPGYEPIKPMIEFTRNHYFKEAVYTCKKNNYYVGEIEPDAGVYRFFPAADQSIDSDTLKEICMKLESLNTKVEVGSHNFTD
jgi:hypothetical protein